MTHHSLSLACQHSLGYCSTYVCKYTDVCKCAYLLLYTYVHTYIYTYTYVHTCKCPTPITN